MEWQHDGQVITMTTEGWFLVADSSFPTLTGAKDHAHKTALNNRQPINLPCLTEKGIPFVVLGVHLGTGGLLTITGINNTEYRFYPDTPWLRAKLAQRTALLTQLDTISKDIGPATLLRPTGRQEVNANANLQAAYDKAKALAVQP